MSRVPVSVLQQAFLDNLDYIESHGSVFQPSNKKQLQVLKQLASSGPLTVEQLGALASYQTDNRNAGMKPIAPFQKDTLRYTRLQFGQANLEWYFMYLNQETFAITFIVFAIPVCNPEIAKKYQLGAYEGYLYCISGGVGLPGDPLGNVPPVWYTIPNNFVQADYQTLGDATFSFSIVPGNNLLSASLNSSSPGVFAIQASWMDPFSAKPVSLAGTLSSADSPFQDGPGGCAPCVSNVGTLYFSYTNLVTLAQISLPNGVSLKSGTSPGLGWFDHQWLQSGKIKSHLIACLSNFEKAGAPAPPLRWLWINLQDTQSRKQYMVIVNLSDVVQEGYEYQPMVIGYDPVENRGPWFWNKTKSTVAVLRVLNAGPYVFPMQYKIVIAEAHKTYYLKAGFGGLVNLPSSVRNWEGCGQLFSDAGFTQRVGNCFLECNQSAPQAVLNQAQFDMMQSTGLKLTPEMTEALLPQELTLGATTASLGYTILVLWLTLVVLYLLAKGIWFLIRCSVK